MSNNPNYYEQPTSAQNLNSQGYYPNAMNPQPGYINQNQNIGLQPQPQYQPQGQPVINNTMTNQQQPPGQYIVQPVRPVQPVVVVSPTYSSPYNSCPVCQHNTQTFVVRKYGMLVWGVCFLLFLFACCLCWIPFLIDSWQDTQYRCKKCGRVKHTEKGNF